MALRTLMTNLSRFSKIEGSEVAETPELYLRLSTKCMEQATRMTKVSTSPRFNHEQCKYIANKLKVAVQNAHSFVEQINVTWYSTLASADNKARSLEILKLLFALGKEVESFIQDCCKNAWIQSAVLLTNVSEHVSTIAFNLEFCTVVFSNRKRIAAIPTLTVTEVASLRKSQADIVSEKAILDKMRLSTDLSALIQSTESSSVEWQLATFLLERLRSPRQHLGLDLAGSNQFSCPEILVRSLKQMESLGKGASGTVHKAMWLGTEVAKKTFHEPGNPGFLQEVSILEGLCHPNIVSLLWYMMDLCKCYIIMELMDGDLYSLIRKRLEEGGCHGSLFTISEAVNIMLQVAEGMLFLHENKIVHRDLKSSNILVRCVKAAEVDTVHYVHAKVADFGLSKTKEKSRTYSNQTLNIGTTRWMAPEVMKSKNDDGDVELFEVELALRHPFKSDVYSFGMLCYEILSGHVPFPALSSLEVRKKVLGGCRPHLPDQCPYRLRILIESCWSSEPSSRPHFGDICAELRHLKCAHLMTSAWAKDPRFSLDAIVRMTNSHGNVLGVGAYCALYGPMFLVASVVLFTSVWMMS